MRTIVSGYITVCEMILHNTTHASSIKFYNIKVPKPSGQKKFFSIVIMQKVVKGIKDCHEI